MLQAKGDKLAENYDMEHLRGLVDLLKIFLEIERNRYLIWKK